MDSIIFILLIFCICSTICCVCLSTIGGIAVASQSSTGPTAPTWSPSKAPAVHLDRAQTLALLGQVQGQSATPQVNCQNLSDQNLTWTGHQGLLDLQDWANFNYQSCNTIPHAYTTTQMFSTYYQNIAQQNPNKDPAITDQQSIDSTGKGTVFNPVSNASLVISQTGSLSLKKNGVTIWSTPASTSGTYSAKFDSSYNNKGNFCVFRGSETAPIWCMLPQVTITTSLNNQPGNLQAIQDQQLASAHLKNSSDTRSRFVMVDDQGNFCMYSGYPGPGQTSQIICK